MVCSENLAKHNQPRSLYNAIVRKKRSGFKFFIGSNGGKLANLLSIVRGTVLTQDQVATRHDRLALMEALVVAITL